MTLKITNFSGDIAGLLAIGDTAHRIDYWLAAAEQKLKHTEPRKVEGVGAVLRCTDSLCTSIHSSTNRAIALAGRARSVEDGGHHEDASLIDQLYRHAPESVLNTSDGQFSAAILSEDGLDLIVNWPGGFHELFFLDSECAVFFASRVALLIDLWGYNPEADEQSVAELILGGHLRTGATMFKNVRRVVPGTLCRIGRDGQCQSQQIYSLEEGGHHLPESTDEFLDLQRRTIKRVTRDCSEVGVFFSGGIDSSINAACVNDVSAEKVRLLTAGFGDSEYDESSVARDFARTINAGDRLEIIPMESADMLDDLPQIIWGIELPTFDSSIVPTSRICVHCAERTQVAIAGDGPDHLLGRSYGIAAWDGLFHVVPGLRALACWLTASSPGKVRHKFWNALRERRIGRRLWLAMASASGTNGNGLASHSTNILYGPLSPSFVCNLLSSSLQNRVKLPKRISDVVNLPVLGSASRLETYAAADCSLSGMNGVFSKIGMASRMAGLDLCEPYLSRPVIEYFWRLHSSSKVQGSLLKRLTGRVPNSNTKLILRDTLSLWMPRHVIDREKQGFSPPLPAWLRDRLKGRAGRNLCGAILTHTDWLNENIIDQLITEHVTQEMDHSCILFLLASLDQWYRVFILGRGKRPTWTWEETISEGLDDSTPLNAPQPKAS
jgi:asparagine synthase (glutamine-hydrolysing)